MKVGIFGGTFNPVHAGHIHIAKETTKKLGLDKLIFVPAYIPPHKKVENPIATRDRLKMLRLAVKANKKFKISLHELQKKGTSYSITTVKALKKRFGQDVKLFFLIGRDSLEGLKKWKNIAALRKIVQFIVVPRGGSLGNASHRGVVSLQISKKHISSTEIRRQRQLNKPIRGMVPKEVELYIKRKNLYRNA